MAEALLFVLIMIVFQSAIAGALLIKWYTNRDILAEEITAFLWSTLMVAVLTSILIFINWGEMMWG